MGVLPPGSVARRRVTKVGSGPAGSRRTSLSWTPTTTTTMHPMPPTAPSTAATPQTSSTPSQALRRDPRRSNSCRAEHPGDSATPDGTLKEKHDAEARTRGGTRQAGDDPCRSRRTDHAGATLVPAGRPCGDSRRGYRRPDEWLLRLFTTPHGRRARACTCPAHLDRQQGLVGLLLAGWRELLLRRTNSPRGWEHRSTGGHDQPAHRVRRSPPPTRRSLSRRILR